MFDVPTLIVGQGLAGTTLAWTLLLRGERVAVMDAHRRPAASRVAAGLLSPVGGRRFALAWRARECWDAAVEFYHRVGQLLGVELLTVGPVVRLFADAAQRDEFVRRLDGPLAGWVEGHDAAVDPAAFAAPLGGCQLRGGRLDVARYLDASRREFARRGLLIEADLDDAQLRDAPGGVRIGDHGAAQRVVLCRGAAESVRPALPFEPARGETLTLACDTLTETRVVKQRVWLAPLGGGRLRVGATFDPHHLERGATQAGRRELQQRLAEFLRVPYQVEQHDSGVRPILRTRRPVAGPLPGRPRVAVLNGLGASGTLWAPWVAGQYADHLLDGAPLDAEIDPLRRLAT